LIIIYGPSSLSQGQITDIVIQAKHFEMIKNNIIKIMSQNCGQPVERVRKDMDRDNFMSAVEALNYGIIDEII